MIRDMFTILLRFALLGSFVGGGVFLVIQNLSQSSTPTGVAEIVNALALILPMAVLASFLSIPFGFFPAIAAGFFYWCILARMKRNPAPLLRVVFGGGIGLFVSVIFGLLFSFSEAPGAHQPVVNLSFWACAGAIASGLSALVIRDATYADAFRKQEV
jgi:hypothetical protein